jgi:hypothetical protein
MNPRELSTERHIKNDGDMERNDQIQEVLECVCLMGTSTADEHHHHGPLTSRTEERRPSMKHLAASHFAGKTVQMHSFTKGHHDDSNTQQ